MEKIYQLRQENEGKNLEILKKFYTDVWSNCLEYVENDKLLYDIFKDKNYSPRIKAVVLNDLYSAGMKGIQIYDFAEEIQELKEDEIGKKQYTGRNNANKEIRNFLISLESKYLHWHNEANNLDSIPIYDGKARNELANYKIDGKILKSKDIKKYNEFKEKIDSFIKNYLGKTTTGNKKIPLEIKGPYEEVSVYRLLDKFLWLSNKFRSLEEKISGNQPNSHEKKFNTLYNNYKLFVKNPENINIKSK